MAESTSGASESPSESTQRLTEAIQRAIREAVITHARMGRSVPEWRDGKVVWATPEEIFAELAAVPIRKPKTGAA